MSKWGVHVSVYAIVFQPLHELNSQQGIAFKSKEHGTNSVKFRTQSMRWVGLLRMHSKWLRAQLASLVSRIWRTLSPSHTGIREVGVLVCSPSVPTGHHSPKILNCFQTFLTCLSIFETCSESFYHDSSSYDQCSHTRRYSFILRYFQLDPFA